METNHGSTSNFDNKQIPQRTQFRREHLLKYIDLSSKGLEIGPYGSPTVFKSEGDISYLDFKPREQLIAEASSGEEIEAIPEIDYLVASNDYRRYVLDTFDYIIANHVIEHVPDMIRWLTNITEMLNPNGILFMAIPDKRFTFDKYRQSTRLSHILNDFYEQAQTISQEHLLEQIIYYDRTYLGEPIVLTERLDRARIEKVLEDGIQPWMIGYHCHIFQSETALDTVFKPLIMMGYINLDIIDYIPAAGINYGEMMLILKKVGPKSQKITLDLTSFFESECISNSGELSSNQKIMESPTKLPAGAIPILKGEAFKLLSGIKRSRFAQKYLKPLYLRFRGTSH